MTKIKVLDSLTIQKIAAGEVIERPASIVKELVENSIDANADSIVIEIKNGGKSLIRVTDNGDGMEKQDLALAFKKHSTSKLNSVEDLYSISSLGFRGEALSSIASVAKVKTLTKTEGAQGGIQALVEEGKILSMETVGCPKGTTMIVSDLFYNLPVRKKFLKSDLSEGNHISDIVYKIALGNPQISFRFIRDNKTVLRTSKTDNLLETIYSVLGRDYSKNLIPIEYRDNYLEIKGFISNNNLYRGNRNHQYIYINNRPIINHGISKVIENQYQTLIPTNRFPVFVLNINLDPGEIDVNIHPAKHEIKFVNQDRVFGSLSNLVKRNLMVEIKRPKMTFKEEEREDKELPILFHEDSYKECEKTTDKMHKEILIHDLTDHGYGQDEPSLTENRPMQIEYQFIESPSHNSLPDDTFLNHNSSISDVKDNVEDRFNHININPIGRAFATYAIVEIIDEEKLLFIDQHAAHERIMYEKFKKEYEKEEIATQQLISPEIIELTNKEMTEFNDNLTLFKDLGFDVERFGTNSIAIRGVPLIFGKPMIKDLFLDLLDGLGGSLRTSYDTRLEKIMKLACTNAIKSGDKIGSVEIVALYKDLLKCNNPHTCPHGRPTIIELSKKDIEKQFLRIN